MKYGEVGGQGSGAGGLLCADLRHLHVGPRLLTVDLAASLSLDTRGWWLGRDNYPACIFAAFNLVLILIIQTFFLLECF